MAGKYKKFREYHLEKLKDAAEAKAYLDLAFDDFHRDGNREELLAALRDVTDAISVA